MVFLWLMEIGQSLQLEYYNLLMHNTHESSPYPKWNQNLPCLTILDVPWCSYGSLACTVLGPKSIFKISRPIRSITIYSFHRNLFDLPVGHFNVPAILWIVPYFSSRVLKKLLQNWEPRSLIIALGVPNLEYIFFFKNAVTLFPSLLGSEISSTHFNS